MLMLLQSGRPQTAGAMAARLEVSVRTVHRDVERLGAAGIPIYTERGRHGGIRLVDGWRTTLTGLTDDEAQAVLLAGLPGPTTQLGMGAAAVAADAKLLAALSPQRRALALRTRERFHLDTSDWYSPTPDTPHLAAVARAVWADQRLRVVYESWTARTRQTIDPLGLVLKTGTWYVVARRTRQIRTYRLSNIHHLETLEQHFDRPDGFDLADHWQAAIERFEQELYRGHAELYVTDRGLRTLAASSRAVARATATTRQRSPRAGWHHIVIPIESPEHAAGQLLALGDDAEVLAPQELRQLLAHKAQRLVHRYGTAQRRAPV
jgi:predicted DNA-binding transcriptional regulator YafY